MLDVLAREDVAPEDHLVAAPVRVEQDEADRVAAVEVPDLVEIEPVEERAARRVVAVEADDRGAGRAAGRAPVALLR